MASDSMNTEVQLSFLTSVFGVDTQKWNDRVTRKLDSFCLFALGHTQRSQRLFLVRSALRNYTWWALGTICDAMARTQAVCALTAGTLNTALLSQLVSILFFYEDSRDLSLIIFIIYSRESTVSLKFFPFFKKKKSLMNQWKHLFKLCP